MAFSVFSPTGISEAFKPAMRARANANYLNLAGEAFQGIAGGLQAQQQKANQYAQATEFGAAVAQMMGKPEMASPFTRMAHAQISATPMSVNAQGVPSGGGGSGGGFGAASGIMSKMLSDQLMTNQKGLTQRNAIGLENLRHSNDLAQSTHGADQQLRVIGNPGGQQAFSDRQFSQTMQRDGAEMNRDIQKTLIDAGIFQDQEGLRRESSTLEANQRKAQSRFQADQDMRVDNNQAELDPPIPDGGGAKLTPTSQQEVAAAEGNVQQQIDNGGFDFTQTLDGFGKDDLFTSDLTRDPDNNVQTFDIEGVPVDGGAGDLIEIKSPTGKAWKLPKDQAPNIIESINLARRSREVDSKTNSGPADRLWERIVEAHTTAVKPQAGIPSKAQRQGQGAQPQQPQPPSGGGFNVNSILDRHFGPK